MKKTLLTILPFVLIAVVIGLATGYLSHGSSNNEKFIDSKVNISSKEIEKLEVPTSTPEPTPTEIPIQSSYSLPKVGAWIPSFDYTRGKANFYSNIKKFTDISPVYYDLKEDGTISSRAIAGDKDLVTKSHNNGVKILPTIISFDAKALFSLVNDEKKLKDHNDFLLNECLKYGYDGVDVDYEEANLTDKDKIMLFIKDLSAKLHGKGKLLSMTLVPKYKDSGYTSLAETREVQDWSAISPYTDQIRIMAYDYSPTTTVGPIAPEWWVESIIKYGIEKGIKDKLIIGQPFYGYAYGAPGKRYAYTYDEIADLISQQKLTVETDKDSGEKKIKFTKGTEERTMYFYDNEVILKRLALAQKYGIKGIFFWRLGGEDSEIYSKIKEK